MTAFKEGFDFFRKNAYAYIGADISDNYITTVNTEIDKLVKDLNSFNGFNTSSKMLKGDVAEFWHSGTFNINSALNDSNNRASVDRSHDFASPDISTNFGKQYGLKF